MSTKLRQLIERTSRLNEAAQSFDLLNSVHELFPNDSILATRDGDFELEHFADAGKCILVVADYPVPVSWLSYNHFTKSSEQLYDFALMETLWCGHRFKILQVQSHENGDCFLLIGPVRRVLEDFFFAVCKYSSEKPQLVSVFERGYFRKHPGIEAAIKNSSFDDLIIERGVRIELEQSAQEFFSGKEKYERYGIPWKRGLLLYGPPGNGKTHAVRALLNSMQIPSIIAGKVGSRDSDGQDAFVRMYRKARELAPVIVVLEDLDSRVDKTSLSVFLNEMDGMSSNDGILTLATTNYPERLGPALIQRPSRFDRKLCFRNPSPELIAEYLRKKTGGWEHEMRPSEAGLEKAAVGCEGFSFAYLQEFTRSCIVSWFHNGEGRSMDEVMIDQARLLQEQLKIGMVHADSDENLDSDADEADRE
ncbi:MAG: AAA family ATPase [Armatimonadetes bacterium]|nr:AAA family ATPase [Armatimonadota bacterium]